MIAPLDAGASGHLATRTRMHSRVGTAGYGYSSKAHSAAHFHFIFTVVGHYLLKHEVAGSYPPPLVEVNQALISLVNLDSLVDGLPVKP